MNETAPAEWYLAEWMAWLQVNQAELMRLTRWDKRKASQLVNCKRPYNRDKLADAAAALGVAPFELLLPVDEALSIRSLRESAAGYARAAEKRQEYRAPDREAG